MFPLNSNMPYIKETGERDKLGNVIGSGGGGGGNIPIATSETLGGIKIGNGLSVEADGTANVSNPFASYGVYSSFVSGYPVFKPSAVENKYNIGLCRDELTSSSTRTFGSDNYNLSDCFLPDVFRFTEFYNYLTNAVITGLELEVLYDGLSTAVETAELAHPITDYDVLVLQGCYNTEHNNQYNTTIFYTDPDLESSYWFGVKDRNSSYSGMLSFTDATHISLSASRRIEIYGIKL